jgi:hypothetical protein
MVRGWGQSIHFQARTFPAGAPGPRLQPEFHIGNQSGGGGAIAPLAVGIRLHRARDIAEWSLLAKAHKLDIQQAGICFLARYSLLDRPVKVI